MIELLVALSVTVTVLGMASVFLGQQVQLQRSVQARNDVQDRIRVAMQLVTQDLSLAGTALRIRPDGTVDTTAPTHDCFEFVDGFAASSYSCVDLQSVDTTESVLRVRYVTSQVTSATSCRDVLYRLNAGALQRADVACGADPTGTFVDLAPDMLGFKVSLLCSNTSRLDEYPAATCASGTAYARSAVVAIAGQSSIPTRNAASTVDFATITVPCPAGRACFAMTQEILMPNLKDR